MSGPYVYISGPYSHPDPVANTHTAIAIADQLALAGFRVYVPHLTMLWHLLHPHDIEFWYEHDLAWLALCDALLRIPGESTGADGEVLYAERHGILVFHSLGALIDHYCEPCDPFLAQALNGGPDD